MSRIFISHSTSDNDRIVEPLNQLLLSQGHQVWYDVRSITISDSIPLEISKGLASSELYLMVISEHYNISPWCKQELGAIIANCIGTPKKMVIIQIDGAQVEPIISHILRIQISSRELQEKKSRQLVLEKIETTIKNISGSIPHSFLNYSTDKISTYVDVLMNANEHQRFGINLLDTNVDRQNATKDFCTFDQSEGLILVKPGGTFYRPCLLELIRRICEKCEIIQMRLFNGELVEDRQLFERQYVSTTRLANGKISLNEEDLKEIRSIYKCIEFEEKYGTPYADNLIVPALILTSPPFNIDSAKISDRWEEGRAEGIFWNKRWNGLNKIGYQKTVFPIVFEEIPEPSVRIVLNGFVPGYRSLFIRPQSRTIAIHVSSHLPWHEIREKLVGGESNPKTCAKGSIRRDAFEGIVPLDPQDKLVNGQRNVCHSSATLFDGMRELIIWFEYRPYQTILGRVLELSGTSAEEISTTTLKHLEDISWTTRDDTFAEILYEARQGIVFDNLKGSKEKRENAIERYAHQAGVTPSIVRNSINLVNFIENGLRLKIAGDEYYLFTIAKNLFDSESHKSDFYEIAREIRLLSSQMPGNYSVEVLAEAYRIAASDLCFLRCPVYHTQIDSPRLFNSLVLTELPEQALACAQRTQRNLITDLIALHATPTYSHIPQEIGQTKEWQSFVADLAPTKPTDDQTVGIIMAGGRSTRMSSTIPKTVLPFGKVLMFSSVQENIKAAIERNITFFAAVGFRSNLVRRALGNNVNYFVYVKTPGLAFRLATCLETLKTTGNEDQLIVLTYTDMPLVSSRSIKELKKQITDKKTFGIVTSYNEQLSGHVAENGNGITRVIQKRLNPNQCSPGMKRDVGLYVFYNTDEFRTALLKIKNDNVRQEFIFADIVEILANQNWKIVSVEEDANNSLSINTTADLLSYISQPYVLNREMPGLRDFLLQSYKLELPDHMHLDTFHASVDSHFGPFYFFSWWERSWLSKQ